MDRSLVDQMALVGREISIATKDDEKLGPLRWLPGQWRNTADLDGYGFNMISLPFGPQGKAENGYRLLMNQYNEALNFIVADTGVPNRGVDTAGDPADQIAVALSYSQIITQVASDDSFLVSASGKTNSTLGTSGISDKFDGKGIHHEPGLWIYMTNQNISDEFKGEVNVARMGSVPHGNSFIATGSATEIDWENTPPDQRPRLIPNINGVVVGGGSDPDERALDPIMRTGTNTIAIDYFAPYRHFHQNPFKGKIPIPGFAGLDPVHATGLLRHAFEKVLKPIGALKNVIKLEIDSTLDHAGIHRVGNPSIGNTPFIARQADTTAMNATFIIYEIMDANSGQMRYFLQYAQNVMLDFINRPDGHPGRARWPHISINTLERVADASTHAIMEGLPPR